MVGIDPVSDGITRQLVYRAREPSGVKGAWERKIVELGDGAPVAEIIEVLFREEIRAGAWAVDIGLWKDLFDQCVVSTISELAGKGYIHLEPIERAKEEPDG